MDKASISHTKLYDIHSTQPTQQELGTNLTQLPYEPPRGNRILIEVPR